MNVGRRAMKPFWPALVVSCITAAATTVPAQRLNPSAREILDASRALQLPEIEIVLAAARGAVSGLALRVSYVPSGPGPEVLMGANGRPRVVRTVGGGEFGGSWLFDANGNRVPGATARVDILRLSEYTGRAARSCDGAALSGELVVDYESKDGDGEWTPRARVLTGNEPLWPAFDILAGSVKVESGHRRTFDGRVARALVAAWKPPAGAQPGGSPPAGAIQSLWIDIDSTLPLRWTISVPGLPAEYSVAFTYDPALDLRLPAVGPPADCVP